MDNVKFESRIDTLYEKWTDYVKKSREGLHDLPEIESLKTEVRTAKEDYTKSIRVPTYTTNIVNKIDTFLYKTKILKPMRDVIFKKENSTYGLLVMIGALEKFVDQLHKEAKDSKKLQ